MILARVDGNAVATIKERSLESSRLLICQPIDAEGNDDGDLVVAIDRHGAGLHQRVMIATDGKFIRETLKDEHSPARHIITAVLND